MTKWLTHTLTHSLYVLRPHDPGGVTSLEPEQTWVPRLDWGDIRGFVDAVSTSPRLQRDLQCLDPLHGSTLSKPRRALPTIHRALGTRRMVAALALGPMCVLRLPPPRFLLRWPTSTLPQPLQAALQGLGYVWGIKAKGRGEGMRHKPWVFSQAIPLQFITQE